MVGANGLMVWCEYKNIFSKNEIVYFLITSQISQYNIQEINKWLHFAGIL